ncbi:MAG: SusC/RagA family TonB-linked outer membrane protein [Thalassobius sp.]|nr:SusC/RagA family TonB-linked outer membrane protein [Thalassovita sp.]
MNLKTVLSLLRKQLVLLLLMAVHVATYAQENITGQVLAEDGEPLPGVSIIIKGTSTGTTTDFDGNFKIAATSEAILQFSYIGYTPQEVTVGSQTNIQITLQPDVEQLDEIVVVGYGQQKKETLTGSISQVKGKDIVKSPQANVSNSLSGRFSGVIANNSSGEPGYDDSNIYIRGIATTGNTDVLVVIDGVPGQIGGLSRLNPNDIESVSVLKDASAAVYGSRAANGVILVTTKKGEQGKPRIDYSYNIGFNSPTRLPDMADAATFATLQNEIAYYNNKDGGLNQAYTEDEIQKFADGSDPINYPNTDWADATLKKTSLQQQHNVSVRGGSENVKYFVSLGKLAQEGLYKDGVTEYNQYSFRSNIDANITEDFSVGLLLNGREEDRIYPTYGAGEIFRSIYRAYPTVVDVYPNGLPSTGVENNNPVMMVTDAGGTSENPTQIFNGILKAKYFIPWVDGLSVDGFYSVDKKWNFTKTFSQPYSVYKYDSDSDTYTAVTTGGSNNAGKLVEAQENISQITQNIKLNFDRYFGDHYINSFIAYEQSTYSEELFDATRLNYPTVETPELSQGGAATSDSDNSGSSYHYNRRSFIGKLAYNYNEKYLAEVQLRVDGSSIFPSDNRYGYFPAISAGWRISEEEWFSNSVNFINDLKIRASYGQLGNDNVDPFQFYNNYSFNNSYVIDGVAVSGVDLTKLGNPAITWEVAKKTDVGINATLFRNISLEFIYFQQNRSDILTARNASIPGVSGIVNPYDGSTLVPDENIGKVNSNGIETTLGYKQNKENFWYSVSANLTYAKSKIEFIDEASSVLDYQQQTGRSLNTYLLYNVLGIFRTEEDLDAYPHLSSAQVGDLIYEDYDEDGEITADDMVRTKYGNLPQITYGINITGGWKNFDVAILFAGQDRVNQYILPESGTVGNFYSSWADNRWSPTNTGGSYPRVDTRASSSINGGLYKNNFWLYDNAFLRLKNISIGYNVPEAILSKAKIAALRIQASAFNLFTITKLEDFDPEGTSESGQFYPQQRIINLGVNVQF